MAMDNQNQTAPKYPRPPPSISGSSSAAGAGGYLAGLKYPNPPEASIPYCPGPKYPNPPDATIPDPETLREQWMYVTKKYNRWFGLTCGVTILAGVTFYGIGWMLKGSSPLPSSR